MKRTVALLALTLAILAAQPYGDPGTLNAGVTWSLGDHCIGVETRGTPGVFVDVDCQ